MSRSKKGYGDLKPLVRVAMLATNNPRDSSFQDTKNLKN